MYAKLSVHCNFINVMHSSYFPIVLDRVKMVLAVPLNLHQVKKSSHSYIFPQRCHAPTLSNICMHCELTCDSFFVSQAKLWLAAYQT